MSEDLISCAHIKVSRVEDLQDLQDLAPVSCFLPPAPGSLSSVLLHSTDYLPKGNIGRFFSRASRPV